MRTILVAVGLAISLLVGAARPALAQTVLPDTIRRSAQRAAGSVLVVDAILEANGTLTVQLEANELSFDRILRQSWPRDLRAPGNRTTAQVGREIAQAAVAASAAEFEVRTVVVIVRSTNAQDDPTRVRLVYPRSELTSASRLLGLSRFS